MPSSDGKRIVIIGGGIVGMSTAYYILRHPLYNQESDSTIVIDAGQLGDGASGKAGGFLAAWATPKCLAPVSFELHAELSKQLDGESTWGYRRIRAAEIKLRSQGTRAPPNTLDKTPKDLDWIRPDSVESYNEVGSPSDSAQVHPLPFLRAMAASVESEAATITWGTLVTSINYDKTGSSVESVTVTRDETSSRVPATHIVVAAGPWTNHVLPSVKLLAPKCHSIVVKPSAELSPYILFSEIESHLRTNESGEDLETPLFDIYPRPKDTLRQFGTVYSSGPDYYDSSLPSSVDKVDIEDDKIEEVISSIGAVSQPIKEGMVLVRQACYKAQIRKHDEGEEVGPILGPMQTKGLWVATGFDEWGIQNAPGAGKVLSEMIFEGQAKSADVDSLHPRHYGVSSEQQPLVCSYTTS